MNSSSHPSPSRKQGFITTTLLGGIFFLLPVVIILTLIDKASVIAMKVATPVAARLPFESVFGLDKHILLGYILIILVCFFAGLLSKTRVAKRFIEYIESNFLSLVPGYTFMKSTSESAAGVESNENMTAVIVFIDDVWQPALQVEDISDTLKAVYIP